MCSAVQFPRVAAAAVLLGLGGASFGAEPVAAPAPVVREQSELIPVTDARHRVTQLHARLCRPAGDAPARLVVINHGSPPHGTANRPGMELGRCESEAAQWFLTRGYVVAFALRRGYGATGGSFAEDIGNCAHPDFMNAGLETARDIDAVVEYATALPFVSPSGAIVVGQSAGGWGTIAYAATPHPKVSGYVVMAGGRGGHEHDQPNHNCRPDLLAEAAGRFGRTARAPMLWIYTANDSYFAPDVAQAMWRAFSAAGGQARLEQLGPFDGDGHHLFFGPGGSAVWGPLLEKYLAGVANAP
jgi:dienelactone hydrolase